MSYKVVIPKILEMFKTLSAEQFPTDQKFKRACGVRRRVSKVSSLRIPAKVTEITFSKNLNECWAQWKEQFRAAVDRFAPDEMVMDDNSSPWIVGKIRHLIRKNYGVKEIPAKQMWTCKQNLRIVSKRLKI